MTPTMKQNANPPYTNEKDRVRIFDTTLRDGEQSPGATMNVEDKLIIARQLEKLGVDVIEAGFAAASDGDAEAVRGVADVVSRPIVLSLARTRQADLEAALRAVGREHALLAAVAALGRRAGVALARVAAVAARGREREHQRHGRHPRPPHRPRVHDGSLSHTTAPGANPRPNVRGAGSGRDARSQRRPVPWDVHATTRRGIAAAAHGERARCTSIAALV